MKKIVLLLLMVVAILTAFAPAIMDSMTPLQYRPDGEWPPSEMNWMYLDEVTPSQIIRYAGVFGWIWYATVISCVIAIIFVISFAFVRRKLKLFHPRRDIMFLAVISLLTPLSGLCVKEIITNRAIYYSTNTVPEYGLLILHSTSGFISTFSFSLCYFGLIVSAISSVRYFGGRSSSP